MSKERKVIGFKYPYWQKMFFDKMSDRLEELYPKGKSKERSKALVFNAYANIAFEEVFDNYVKAITKELK